ncbi:hypothetical protein B0H11DRAFT_2191872 [Mycena galericulata]|nr:hypothetical protein B0H11DRAFT_2191872 [Mycena galericulata]
MSGDGAGPSSSNAPSGLDLQNEVVQECTALVQQFHDRNCDKTIAVARIMGAIPTAFVEGEPGQQVARAYIGMLDQIEGELIAAARRSNGGGRRSRSPPPNGGGGRRSRSPSPNGGGGRRSRSPDRGGRGRSRSASPADESSSKRRRVNDSMLPWVVEDFIIEPTLSPELAKTRRMLLEFAKDPKYVLGTIRNSTNHVAFPDSEWLAIIKGGAVDLNKVITNQFSVSHESQRTEVIGDGVQILFGSSTPTKTICTHAEWLTAWQYIIDLFISSAEHVHERIILLDRKLRNEVAGRRDLSLSDCGRFGHWERSFLSDSGAADLDSKPKAKDGRRGGGTGGSGEKKKSEPCRRFNDERSAVTLTSARGADATNPSRSATDHLPFLSPSKPIEPRAKRPRYLRDFIWPGFDDDFSPTPVSTEFDPPLPPSRHLFKFVTPINIDAFESLLTHWHPNRPFVSSVITGLREGFWPWVDTRAGVYPDVSDVSDCPLKSEKERQFVRDQRDAEIALGRFSPAFGPDPQ